MKLTTSAKENDNSNDDNNDNNNDDNNDDSELFKIKDKIHDNSDEDIRVKEDETDNKVKKSYF